MTAPLAVVSELQKVAPSQIIELFELQLKASLHGSNDVYRFHAGVNGKPEAGNIVWNGNAYQAYPVEADGFEYNGEGQLPRPKLRVSNQLGLISAILLSVNAITPGNDLIGATVTRIRTLAKHLDAVNFPGNVNPYGTPDPTAEFPKEVFYVARKTAESRDVVEFELASAFDLAGVRAPRRLCIANMCNWVYRSAECGYTGTAYFDEDDQPTTLVADDVCSKRLTGCEARFGPLAFTGSATAGSTTLSGINADIVKRINPGNPVSGYAIPAGTTVVSRGTTSIVMSQAATGVMTYSLTGTLSSPAGITLTVSSAANLAVGMIVSGPNVPTGTTITGISGNVLTLSIAYNINSRGVPITKSARVNKSQSGTEFWEISDLNGIYIDDLAGNLEGLTDAVPQGVGVYQNTKVKAITDNVEITKQTSLPDDHLFTAVFWEPVTFASATYTFTPPNTYTVRPGSILPYGSFPGVGAYY